MNINGTCTHHSDIYFDCMMLAFEDFITRHRLKSVQSTSERQQKECQKYVNVEGSILDSRIMFGIQSSLELRERCSCLRYRCMRRCPLSSTQG